MTGSLHNDLEKKRKLYLKRPLDCNRRECLAKVDYRGAATPNNIHIICGLVKKTSKIVIFYRKFC